MPAFVCHGWCAPDWLVGWPGLSVFAKARSFLLTCAVCAIEGGRGPLEPRVGYWHSNPSVWARNNGAIHLVI